MPSDGKIFRRFFAVYAFFFVCMLLMLIPIYHLSLNEIELRTLKTAGAVLESGLDTFEDALHAASVAADILYRDQQIFRLAQLKAPLSAIDGYRILQGQSLNKKITSILPLISNSGLHLRNGSLFFSKCFFLDANDAFGIFLNDFESIDTLSWFQRLNLSGNSHSLVSMPLSIIGDTQERLIFSLSLPLNSSTKQTFFFSIYNAEDILQLMILPQYLPSCALTLQDSNQGIIWEHTPDQNAARTLTIEANGGEYGLQASLQIDTSVFSEELRPFRTIAWIGLLLYIAVGLVLILVCSWRNARPMVHMVHAAKETSLASSLTLNDSTDNSFQYIHSFIHQMGDQMADSRRELAEQFAQLQESMLDLLLQGTCHGDRLAQAQRCFPDFPAQCQMVTVHLLHASQYSLEALSTAHMLLLDALKALLPSQVLIHRVSPAQLVLLWPLSADSPADECERTIFLVAQELRNNPEIEVKFALSHPFSGIEKLHETFEQLRQLIHIVGYDGESVIFASNIGARTNNVLRQSTSRFYDLLLQGNADVAMSLMDVDVTALKQTRTADETAIQQLFFLYRHALMRTAEELNGEIALSVTLPRYQSGLNIDENFGALRECGKTICSQINQHRKSAEETFERKIIRFIDAHLADPGLCIRLLTDEFNISESSLRRMLLKATNGNFLEYVEKQRMQLAASLLSQTDMPVGQIPQHCGYASANSFYKAFKRHFDISPSQMRNNKMASSPFDLSE